jgi:ribokinase
VSRKPVVVLGDVNVDLVINMSPRGGGALPASLSEPQLCGGGTAGNTAAALARLGAPVAFIGAIGDDGYGRWARADCCGRIDDAGLVA